MSDNRGNLQKNKQAKPDGTGPQYVGKLRVDGRNYTLAAWQVRNKLGEKFLSIAVKPLASETEPG